MRPLLVLLFIVVPLVEVAIILQVRAMVGLDWTLLALLVMSVLGAMLVKREGVRAWGRFRAALESARLPAVEVTDGALVLVGGALLLTPGFLTDLVGLLLVLPLTRGIANRALRGRVRRAFGVGAAGRGGRGRRQTGDERVVDVEVVNVERHNDDPDAESGVA